jgi:hypothetical protein
MSPTSRISTAAGEYDRLARARQSVPAAPLVIVGLQEVANVKGIVTDADIAIIRPAELRVQLQLEDTGKNSWSEKEPKRN